MVSNCFQFYPKMLTIAELEQTIRLGELDLLVGKPFFKVIFSVITIQSQLNLNAIPEKGPACFPLLLLFDRPTHICREDFTTAEHSY